MDGHRGGRELAWILWTIVAVLFLIFGVVEVVSARHAISFWLVGGLVGTSCSIVTLALSSHGGGAAAVDAPGLPEVAFGPVPNVPQGNLDATVAALQHEASVQAESAAAWDAKLMGILAFMAAAAALLLTVENALHSYRWILFVGAAGASVLALVGLLAIDDTQSGPDPADFYDKYGAATTVEFLKQMIDDFRELRATNASRVEQRRGMASVSFACAVLAGIAFGLARAAVAIWS